MPLHACCPHLGVVFCRGSPASGLSPWAQTPPTCLGTPCLCSPLALQGLCLGGLFTRPFQPWFLLNLGGRMPPLLSSYTVSLEATLVTNIRVHSRGRAGHTPHPISSCSFTEDCHSGERGTPIPALMCPSQPYPSPSPPAGRGGGPCSPPVSLGLP